MEKKSHMNELTESIAAAIVEQGSRLTASRRTIIETLVESEGHITADDLAEQVRKRNTQIGRMTVYRTLELLCHIGVVRPIYQGTGAAHYILMVGGSHHHLICNHCHAVIEFDDCFADELEAQLAEKFNFQVKTHLLEMHGLCQECSD